MVKRSGDIVSKNWDRHLAGKRDSSGFHAWLGASPIFRRSVSIAIVCTFLATSTLRASPVLPEPLRKVGFDQRLNEQVPLDLAFVDEQAKPVRLGDYFDGKPVVLVLAYYQCPMLCTQVLNGMVQGLRETNFSIGRDFRVLTVSFDPRDTPEAAAAKKRTYVRHYAQPEAAEGWNFLTGSPESIARLTEAVGFRYVFDERTQQFGHASGIVLLTPGGTISRYFYDIHFSGRELRWGLVEASANKIGTPVDQVLLFCFHYDPAAGRYGAAIMNIIRVSGVLTVLGISVFLGVLWKRDRRASAAQANQQPPVEAAV